MVFIQLMNIYQTFCLIRNFHHSDYHLSKNEQMNKQEGAELCQAQLAEYKLFGLNWAIFWLVLIVELWNGSIFEFLNCWIVKLLNCWIVELLNL